MSFHFTQFCAFIAYSFRFMGYYLCFIGAKIDNFQKVQGIGYVFFKWEENIRKSNFYLNCGIFLCLFHFYCFDIQLFNISKLSFNSIKLIQSQNL